jgi:hypothetical protein
MPTAHDHLDWKKRQQRKKPSVREDPVVIFRHLEARRQGEFNLFFEGADLNKRFIESPREIRRQSPAAVNI